MRSRGLWGSRPLPGRNHVSAARHASSNLAAGGFDESDPAGQSFNDTGICRLFTGLRGDLTAGHPDDVGRPQFNRLHRAADYRESRERAVGRNRKPEFAPRPRRFAGRSILRKLTAEISLAARRLVSPCTA